MSTEMSEDFFSRRRQFLRVLAQDWRQNRLDILWGVFYVLIGFYLGRPRHLGAGHLFINAPFGLLGGVMAYLTMRLCYVERREKASVFFFNLPRERILAWQAHVTLLFAVGLALEGVIGAAMALRLNAPPGAFRYHTTPAFVSLPFLVVALVLWAIYFPRQWFCQILAFIALPFAMMMTQDWAGNLRRDYYQLGHSPTLTNLDGIADPGLPMVALALTFLVLACVRRRWRKTQLGEVL